MALTKISRSLLDTGISDSSDATAITIDSSENVGIACTPHFPFDVQLNSSRRIGFNYSDSQNSILSHDGSGNIETLGLRGNTILFYSDYDASNPDGVERMRIDSSGNVVIGGTTAGRKFHVNGITRLEVSTAVNYPILEFYNTNGEVGRVRTSGIATAYDTSSDYRLKENVRPMENGLDRLNNLKPVKFDWKVDGTTSEGFIAHEAQEVFPDAVGGQKDGEDMQGMDYGRITPLLVKAIQEQQTIIEDLKARIETLEGGE